MQSRKKTFIELLENRIALYRRCMVGTFVLGLAAGISILCGKSTFILTEWSGYQQISLKVFSCFLIVVTGIATGSAYRRRIRHVKAHQDKIRSSRNDNQNTPKDNGEPIITEIQALFGILFVLVVIGSCLRYPIPNLPSLLDGNLVRLFPIIGFVALCWVSVSIGRKHSLIRLNLLQDFLESQQKRVRIENNRKTPHPYISLDRGIRKGGVPQVHTNQPMQP